MMRFLSRLFELGVRVRWWLYRVGVIRVRSLHNPVISVGNLTVGGTGKTPYVAFLARLLQKNGYQPIILSRGYRGRRKEKVLVVSDGRRLLATPEQCGDEPYWLAETLEGIPVVVSKSRYEAGRAIEDRFQRVVHILDDGFQHLQLARNLDIVLVDGTQPLLDSRLLPAGRLREPLQALRRADLLIVTRAHLAVSSDELEVAVRRIQPQLPITYFYHDAVALQEIRTGNLLSLRQWIGQPVVALAAIGNPEVFLADLNHYQFRVVSAHFFRDHHAFTQSDLDRLTLELEEKDARAIITTEKDAVRLRGLRFKDEEILALKIEPRPESEADHSKSILEEVAWITSKGLSGRTV